METMENMQQTQMQFMETTWTPTLLSKAESAILDAIYAAGSSGIIAAELCRELPQYAYGTVTSKFQKLLRLGLISKIGQRTGPHGVVQSIWQHTAYYKEAMSKHG